MSSLKPAISLLVLMIVQIICAIFFISDVVSDAMADGPTYLHDRHLQIEIVATAAMLIAVVVEGRMLIDILRRQARMERGLSIASGALNELIADYFEKWGLTPSEQDVATFTLKGFSIAEVAQMRGSREGTIKAHLNAIYRKASVTGRAQLTALLIEDLMGGALVRSGRGAKGWIKAENSV